MANSQSGLNTMNPNCNLCHGMGWYWAELTAYGKKGEFSRPCPNCSPEQFATWSAAGEQGRRIHESFKALEANRHEPKVHYQQEWLGEKLAPDNNRIAPIPCVECGKDVIEFSVPNDIWNRVMRPDGDEHGDDATAMNDMLRRFVKARGIVIKYAELGDCWTVYNYVDVLRFKTRSQAYQFALECIVNTGGAPLFPEDQYS